ncbi:efflux RND transporter permease subunit [Halioxenophilus sp. WMMB6]|uniref:efflux RND transporter permease subunit n=1 Tax=Halioxenophilus sp. WMMB6 TaxID=3073815 RepID=UPI00295E67CF|nr:MMPL family transporter [Halioxenophilus sp. WMMB6]
MNNALFKFYEAIVIDRPRLTLVIVALVALLMALGLPKFKLDASADALTLEADRDLDFYREISQRYQTGDLLVVTYNPNGELFTPETLSRIQKLRDELLEVDGVSGALSILDVPLLYSPLQSVSDIRQGVRTLENSDAAYADAKQEFLNSPVYKNLILGPDGETTAIALQLAVDEQYIELVRARDALRLKRRQEGLTSAEAAQLEELAKTFRDYRTLSEQKSHARVAEVRAIANKYKDNAQIFIGGVTMVTADMISFIRSDLVVFGSAIIAFLVLLLAIIFRRPRFVVLPLITSSLSILLMLGFLSWIDWRLTVISSNFVALLLIVTLAITIHLVVRYREYHSHNPDWSQKKLVASTARIMFKPCLYTVLTTIVAFASLVVSGIRPVIDFGWMMTIGLTLSFVLVFVVLPAGLMLLPSGAARTDTTTDKPFTLKFSCFTEKRGNWVIGVSLLLAVISGIGFSRLQVDNRFIDYFHKSTEIYQGMKVIDQNMGGTIGLDIIVDVDPELANPTADATYTDEDDPFAEADPFDQPDPFEAPEPLTEADPFADADPFSEHSSDTQSATSYWFTVAGLRDLQRIQAYLNSLTEIGRVDSLATFYEVARDINHGTLNDFELAVARNSLPLKIEDILISPYLDSEHDQARVSMRVKETDPKLKRLLLVGKIRDHLVNELGFKPEQIHFTGALVLYNNMLESLFRSQILTLGAVFIAIMLMFMVLFRSLKVALIAIIPNVLAAMVVLGGMGLAGISLDMMTITIAAITVGIGVDDTIHYIHRFQEEIRIDGDYIAAMHRSHGSIGSAMYYTSVTIIVGFSVLALSKFIPSIYFGLLTGLAMLAAILGALTLLPKLILMAKPFAVRSA